MTGALSEKQLAAVDAAARASVAAELNRTLFVNAGAGTGKTHSLVSRVAAMIQSGIPLSEIAVVTFTERAGEELRQRLRKRLSESPSLDEGHAVAALHQLDGAAIGTLHAFARRILAEHAISAGLPPAIDVADALTSEVAADQQWDKLFSEILDIHREALQIAMDAGVTEKHLRDIFDWLSDNWDLIEKHSLAQPPARDLPALAKLWLQLVDTQLPQLDLLIGAARDPGKDKLTDKLEQLQAAAQDVQRGADAGDVECITAGIAKLPTGLNVGSQGNWNDGLKPLGTNVADLKVALKEVVIAAHGMVPDFALRAVVPLIAAGVLRAAQERRQRGTLRFNDLLVLARDLVTESNEARAALHEEYKYLLLDEFQDTDPLQIEIAVRVAADPEADPRQPWPDLAKTIEPGRLFFVGDAKQSIYRFRRADIELFLMAQQEFTDGLVGAAGGGAAALSQNFRTRKPVVDWINQVFSSVIAEQPGVQPGYQPLFAHRRPGEHQAAGGEASESTEPEGIGPAVVLLGMDVSVPAAKGSEPNAEELRRAEAADVAATIVGAIREKWQVLDEGHSTVAKGKHWRDIEPRDICVLIPTRTSLPDLRAAFEAGGIPYTATASSLVYVLPEVRWLLYALRAVVDETDAFWAVQALRTPLFGCSDTDLYCWASHTGLPLDGGAGSAPMTPRQGNFALRSDIRKPAPGAQREPSLQVRLDRVGAGLAELRRLARQSRQQAPADLLEQLITYAQLREAAALNPTQRDATWRHLRMVVAAARTWSQSTQGTLDEYLAWVGKQQAESKRVAEPIIDEQDSNTVQIMTIHAAKGLEFPCVILAGMSGERSNSGIQFGFGNGAWGLYLKKELTTAGFADQYGTSETARDEAEFKRLLYVAATRARDHLVVSLYGADKKRSGGGMLRGAPVTNGATIGPPSPDQPARLEARPGAAIKAPTPWSEWLAGAELAREKAAQPGAITPSSLEGARIEFPAYDDDDEPDAPPAAILHEIDQDQEEVVMDKGRFGSVIGTATHAALEAILSDPAADYQAAIVAASTAAGLAAGQHQVVADYVQRALDSDIVRQARASTNHIQEMPILVPAATLPAELRPVGLEHAALEGVIDLVFQEPDGSYTIVDYKTDTVDANDEPALRAKVAYYRPQMLAYQKAFESATGMQAKAKLLFLHPAGGAVERRLNG